MITEGDFINFAKRLAKPKGRQPSSGRLVKEKKKKMVSMHVVKYIAIAILACYITL